MNGPNLVNGIRFEGLLALAKPESFALSYCENGAYELIRMDSVASLYGLNGLLDIVERSAHEVFLPPTVGGLVRSVDDIRSGAGLNPIYGVL